MPVYEYRCEDDGERITLLRPMSQADDPVDDPKGRGRRFTRVHSTFSVGGAAPASTSLSRTGGAGGTVGGCACGNPHGACASGGV